MAEVPAVLRLGDRLVLFVSSRCAELSRQRQVVAAVAEELGFRVVRSETLGMPVAATPLSVCERAAMECDLYVLLVGREYGLADPRLGGLSITHREFQVAKAHNRGKVLVYVQRRRGREQGAVLLCKEVTDTIDGYFVQEFSSLPELTTKVRTGIISWLHHQAAETRREPSASYAVISRVNRVRLMPNGWWRSRKVTRCRALVHGLHSLPRRMDPAEGRFDATDLGSIRVLDPPNVRLKRNPFGIGSSATNYDVLIVPPLHEGEELVYADELAWRNPSSLTLEGLADAPRRKLGSLLLHYSYRIPYGMQHFKTVRRFPRGYPIQQPALRILRAGRRVPELERLLAPGFTVAGDGLRRAVSLQVEIERPPVGCLVGAEYLPPRLAEIRTHLRRSMGLE